jgi:hypothetical protein
MKEAEYDRLYFVSRYENKTMKYIEIVFRREEGNEGEQWKG